MSFEALREPSRNATSCRLAFLLVLLCFLPLAAWGRKSPPPVPAPPDILLEGGRKLSYERVFSSELDVRKKPGFFGKVLNFVAGAPDVHFLVRPYSLVVDSHGRAIITDPGAGGFHIFDFPKQKYKFVQRQESGKDPMLSPQCVTVDAQDNIYITDSSVGKIFVFAPSGKFERTIGSLRGGEGYFKRPTGIAIDSAAQKIYVTDTLRDRIFVLNMKGEVLQTIGEPGGERGQLHFPTEVKLMGEELIVVDAMNFRIQILDRSGSALSVLGQEGENVGSIFRPKGVAVDSEGHFYLVEALRSEVQVFDRQGQLLYSFGKRGIGLGDFQLPTGVFIDHDDHVYVVDSYNRRIQVFRYLGLH